jgi:hypothetical protein
MTQCEMKRWEWGIFLGEMGKRGQSRREQESYFFVYQLTPFGRGIEVHWTTSDDEWHDRGMAVA